jgi:hypothetical protein
MLPATFLVNRCYNYVINLESNAHDIYAQIIKPNVSKFAYIIQPVALFVTVLMR